MAYPEQFPIGTAVKIKSLSFLEQFNREWRYHHPICDEQLVAAGKETTVKAVGFYHGGDVLHELSDIPGTWHEACLEKKH